MIPTGPQVLWTKSSLSLYCPPAQRPATYGIFGKEKGRIAATVSAAGPEQRVGNQLRFSE